MIRHKSSWSVCTRARRRKQSSCRARCTRHENYTRNVTEHLARPVAHGHHEHQHTRERPHDNSTDIGDTHGKRHANPCPMRCTGHLPKLRAARAHTEQQQPSDGRPFPAGTTATVEQSSSTIEPRRSLSRSCPASGRPRATCCTSRSRRARRGGGVCRVRRRVASPAEPFGSGFLPRAARQTVGVTAVRKGSKFTHWLGLSTAEKNRQ